MYRLRDDGDGGRGGGDNRVDATFSIMMNLNIIT